MDKFELLKTLKNQGIGDVQVLNAIANVPRENFVAFARREQAYENIPLSIGNEQTISQPYIVAYMTEQLMPLTNKKVLEIGTGSGYQAAILASCGAKVYSVERIDILAQKAKTQFCNMGLSDISVLVGNGCDGWLANAPYDAIIVTAVAKNSPPPKLLQQLAVGGQLIIPIENEKTQMQHLFLIKKLAINDYEYQQLIPVRFVPLIND